MKSSNSLTERFVIVALFFLHTLAIQAAQPASDKEGWIELKADEAFTAWKPEHKGWVARTDAKVDDANDKKLKGEPGAGVLISGGGTGNQNLYTTEEFGDLEVKFEFMIAHDSNSGVKLNGLYEIQILDTAGKKDLTGDSLGGVYPRAEMKPSYKYLDDGVPPRVNAAKPAGEWQTMELSFRTPRFDAAGKKIENARFLRVLLNEQLVQEDVELKWPTGHAWDEETEVPKGPLMFQGDHGPVALRKIMIRPLQATKK